jgi:trehalose-6-phosphate hydrolase
MSSTSLENCILYSNPEQEELSMTFNFHHLKVDYPNGQKWELMPYDFEQLKSLLSDWQTGMQAGGGWNALFLNNHDQPRALSRFTDDGEYRIESAKLLAITLHGLQGTPYIFQGEEIGLPNPQWKDIREMRDIESHNMYRILQEQGKSPEEAFAVIRERSRDNARTPMPWNSGPGAGFTSGTPWIKLDERYPAINVQDQLADPDSVFHHYKKLIALRKEMPIFTEGTFVRLDERHPQVFAYGRWNEDTNDALLVVSNFSSRDAEYRFPDQTSAQWLMPGDAQLLAASTPEAPALDVELILPPYGSYMWRIRR